MRRHRTALVASMTAVAALLAGCSGGPGSGPAAVQAPGTTRTYTDGSGRTVHPYLVYTPTSYTSGRPLLVMLHGCQTTAEQQMEANLYNPLADEKDFVVAYPDTDATERAQPGALENCWQFWTPQDSRRGQGDLAAIAAITRTVVQRWRIDPDRVYLMGMSAGAFLTSNLAAAYPDLFAAVGQNAGGAYADSGCLLGGAGVPVEESAQRAFAEMGPRARIVPRLVIGGDDDTAVAPACADKSVQQGLRTDNLVVDGSQTAPISLSPASVTTRAPQTPGGHAYTVSTYVDQHGCVISERYLVHGMEHFWSGGSGNPKWSDFTDPKGPSAAAASWAFFSRFTRSDTARPCRS